MTLHELRASIESMEDLQIRRPLTLWRAWDREAPRTSQRRALQSVATHKVVFVSGGNRSGKTELLRAVLVALICGADHPDAIDFWRANGVDPVAADLPRGPGHGWIVALRSSDSLTYHRQQILALIPKWGPRHPDSEGAGRNWHAWNLMGKDEARLQFMVPGYSEPAEILFKSDDPGPDSMQGDSCRVILHDEESRKHGKATWEEAGVRLWDQSGWHLMSNTPTRGRTWLWTDHFNVADETEAKIWIWSEDNPHLPQAEVEKLRRKDPATAAIRLRGEFVALEGRVWPAFNRAIHVVPPFPIPDSATLFRGIDFGTRAPFACGWFVLLKHPVVLPSGLTIPAGSLVMYRERYVKEQTLAVHVEAIRRSEGWVEGEDGKLTRPADGKCEHIEVTWADPEDAQQLLQLVYTHGMEDVVKATKAVVAGITCVSEWLAPGIDGRPSLYIVDTCVNAIREVEDYTYGDRGESEKPVGQSDHTCDLIRYVCMGVRAWLD